ncbi:hypothetical protein Vadar_004828 [Vaccinium darrowii]|uniref:Uncharacterized protein n=1 Tax=Vaccinium darrowii TaxID=229202 RepID=A0ACB7Z1N6_9ERIC|nr:hypothetical protein Vadar_004828 [Vaccinium darrowii]
MVITPLVISAMSVIGIEDQSAIEAVAHSESNLKGVILKAKHVAEAALFLASDESSFVVNVEFYHMTNLTKKRLWLEGKVAIITGAASGIGEATAKVFVDNGAFVVVADIQEELGLKVVASIRGPDHKAIFKKCDVTVEKQVEEVVAFAIEKYGTLDIMYSNAGILGSMESILDMDMEKGFDRIMTVNLRGSAICIKHAARAMVKRQVRGSIICTASTASIQGGMGPLAYTTSKHGLVGLVRAAASELGKHGIRVNCVSPFFVITPLTISGMSALGIEGTSAIEAIASSAGNLKGVVLEAKNVAESALFLASDESSFVSGHNLVIDGGFTVVDNSIAMLMEMQAKQ